MRRSLLGILLATPALVAPSRAAAEPVTGFIAAVSSAVSSAGAALGIGSAAAGAGVAAGASLGTFATKTLVAVGLNYVASALSTRSRSAPVAQRSASQAPQTSLAGSSPSAQMVNYAQPIAYAEWCYGYVRKGGPLGFTGAKNTVDTVTGRAGAKRHYSPILAAHPCGDVIQHWLDDHVVEVDGNGTVTTAPYAGYYRIRYFNGAPGQTADAELVNSFSEVTSAFDFAGLTGAHIWAAQPSRENLRVVYPTGRQASYAPVFEGHAGIYDPRDASTGFTRNAALIVANWLTGVWGLAVDWDEVGDEADACDVTVYDRDSNPLPKWTIDGTISDAQTFEQQRAQMVAACDAWMYERPDGAIGFRVGRYIEPTITLTDDDFYSLQIEEGGYGHNRPTEVAADFIDPANAWRSLPSATYVADASSRQVREKPQLDLVAVHNQAYRINKRIAHARRPAYRLRGVIGPIGHMLNGHRFVRVQAIGADIVCEVDEMWRNPGGASFELGLSSVLESDFDPAVSEPAPPERLPVVSSHVIDAVTGLASTSDGYDGLIWQWDQPTENYVQQVRTRPLGGTDWYMYDLPSGSNIYRQPSLGFLATWEMQVRNVSIEGVPGAWKPDTPAQGTTSAPIPLMPTVGAITVGPGRITISGTAQQFTTEMRLYTNSTDDLPGATLIATISVDQFDQYEITAGFAGDNLVVNGDFDSAAGWSGTGWTIANGVAEHTYGGGSTILQRAAAMDDSTDYRWSYEIVSASTAVTQFKIIGSSTVSATPTQTAVAGRYGDTITSPINPTDVGIYAGNFSDAVIDNVFLFEPDGSELDQGTAYFYLVPVSATGIEGQHFGLIRYIP